MSTSSTRSLVRSLSLAAALMLGADHASAAIIVQYTLEGTPPEAPTTVATGATATNIIKGTGVTVVTEGTNNYLDFLAQGGVNRLATFTITADALKLLDLDQPLTLSFDARDTGGGGIRGFFVHYSYDNGTTFTTAGNTGDVTDTFAPYSFTIPNEFALPVAGTPDLTIQLEGGRVIPNTGTTRVHADNITLNGVVVDISTADPPAAAVPEPVSAALALGGLVALMARRRREM